MKTLLLATLAILSILSAPVQAQDVERLTRQLAITSRPEADRVRDPLRKPAEVLAFLEIKPGMTVVDLIAVEGFYTEVLSIAVGQSGKVFMHNLPASLEGKPAANKRASIEKRLRGDRLSNVTTLHRDFDDLGLPENSVDAAIISLEIHEFYGPEDGDAAVKFFQVINAVLKPGGILGVVDHVGNADGTAAALHRAVEAQVIADAKSAGFALLGTSDILHNPEDDHSKVVFDPKVRGITDRFILKLQKPL